MWIRLDLSGTIFYLKVTGYEETTELDWFDKWCTIDGCIENPNLHIDLQGEVLLASEIDWLANNLDDLVNDRLSELRSIDCIEPILSFVLYPKEDLRKNPQIRGVQEGRESEDIRGEMIVHLWAEGGADEKCYSSGLA